MFSYALFQLLPGGIQMAVLGTVSGLILGSLVSSSAFAWGAMPRMAARGENESFVDASIRFSIENASLNRNSDPSTSVYATAKPVEQVTFEQVPEWDEATLGSLQAQFERIRNVRFIEDPEDATFQRRSSWLYPDDGCFARASLAIQNLGLTTISVPKVFVFGSLKVNTTNHPRGYVTWWYHVVPIVRLNGEPWILDPAVESQHPMKLSDWLSAVNVDGGNLQIAICQGDTLHPFDVCWSSAPQDGAALDLQKYYLRAERRRLNDMGRDVARELGDFPPWLAPAPVPTVIPIPTPMPVPSSTQQPIPVPQPTSTQVPAPQPSPVPTVQPIPQPSPTQTSVSAPERVVPVVPALWNGLIDGFRRFFAPIESS